VSGPAGDDGEALADLGRLDQRRRARYLWTGGLIFFGITASNVVEAALAGNRPAVALGLVLVAVAALAAAAARAGWLRAASGMCTAFVVAASLMVVASGATGSTQLGILLAGVIFVGLTTRPLAAPLLALALALLVVAAVAAQAAGWQPPLTPIPRPLWFTVFRQVAVTLLMVVAFRAGFARLLALRAQQARVLLQAEQELDEAHARLEREVAARSQQIASATRDLEVFVASVSHDLKAPLRHIEGFVELFLEAGPMDPADEARLREVSQAASALAGKVEAIVEREAAREGAARGTKRAAFHGSSTWP
jgi:signal transduction histidine kinase